MSEALEDLKSNLAECTICAERFAATKTRHRPRPIIWFKESARILVASQAPGLRVHEDGRPFWDRSGDRLRDWMGVDKTTFHDTTRVAIVPMAFCFPGYDASGSDLPPPKICAETWRSPIMDGLKDIKLTLLIGGYAQSWHTGSKANVTDAVASWRDHLPHMIPLPHPSWRNAAWLKRHPWFEAELLPVLQRRVAEELQ